MHYYSAYLTQTALLLCILFLHGEAVFIVPVVGVDNGVLMNAAPRWNVIQRTRVGADDLNGVARFGAGDRLL